MTKTLRSEGQVALVSALIKARKEKGLTQAEFAERLRCHQSFVARIESGQRRIDVPELVILCRALEADPIEIVQTITTVMPLDARI